MPKYHLVSDLLNDLMIEDRGDFYRFGCLRKMIEDEWVEGTIKMLRVSPESAEPVVWEPAQRQLTTTMVSEERWIKCRISQGIKVLFEDPFISNEDIQYVKGRAVEAGLVLAEPISKAPLTGAIQSSEPGEMPASATAETTETENVDIAKASFEVAIATPTGAIQSPEPEEILSPTTAETIEAENVDIAKASSEVAITTPVVEQAKTNVNPKKRRLGYNSELQKYMATKKPEYLARLDDLAIEQDFRKMYEAAGGSLPEARYVVIQIARIRANLPSAGSAASGRRNE